MLFPIATLKTAFIAGISLSVPTALLAILKSSGASSYGADSPAIFPFVFGYFLLTGLVFVIDIRSLAPKELKTRIPLVYFPTDRQGFSFLLRVLGRSLVWLLGVAAGVGLLVPLWCILT
jgi:hypothetical protein